MLTVDVDAHPEHGVRTSQPEGIGRVAALGGRCAWNNLGRNVVFATPSFEPVAVFGETGFADDETSQYDLDVHAILDVPSGVVLMVNHLGLVRGFRATDLDRDGALRTNAPVWTRSFVGDMERIVALGARLVGSRPRETRAGGVLVSEPLSLATADGDVDADLALEPWGPVTALGALSLDGRECVAVGGTGRVGLVPLVDGHLGEPCWQCDVDLQPATFLWEGGVLWVAGSEIAPGVDDYDWERLRGGGFVGLDPADGTTLVAGRFEPDLAWGNGGAAVALVAGAVCGIGRTGELHLYDARDGRAVTSTAPIASRSLGIAHAAAVGDHLLYGFNRGGYRLHAVAASTIEQLVAGGK